jgi:hypothetical protein
MDGLIQKEKHNLKQDALQSQNSTDFRWGKKF